MIDENCVKWLRLIFFAEISTRTYLGVPVSPTQRVWRRRSASPRTQVAVADTVGASIMPFCVPW